MGREPVQADQRANARAAPKHAIHVGSGSHVLERGGLP